MKFFSGLIVGAACLATAVHGECDEKDRLESVEGKGFGFPLHGLPSTIGWKPTEGLDLIDADTIKETDIHTSTSSLLNEAGEVEEFITVDYRGEKVIGEDLEEWVKRSRTSYLELLRKGEGQPQDWDDKDYKPEDLEAAGRALQNSTRRLRALNTFGVDNRIGLSAYWMDRFPHRTVGHLQPVGCTGTMIAKNAFLTNRHCVLDSNNNLRYGNNFWSTMNLQLGRSDNQYNYKVYFNRVTWSWSSDWAIVRTNYNVGSYTGYLGYKGRSWWHFVFDKTLTMTSYSGEYFANTGRPGIHIGCRSRGAELAGYIRHDCDAERGSSGSAMVEGIYSLSSYASGGPYVVGVNFAERRNGGVNSLHLASYSNNRANLFWPGSRFAYKITEVRNTW